MAEFKPQLNYIPENLEGGSLGSVDKMKPNTDPPELKLNTTNVGGGADIVRKPIQSLNYSKGKKGAGYRIDPNGDAEFQNIRVNNVQAGGVIEITVETTDNLQKALDEINTQGGGTLRLSPGTYTVDTDLNMYDSTTIQGDSNANTFIDFNSNSKSIKWTGTDIYTTGSISSTSGTTVNGSGTTWTSAMVGRHILMDERWYRITGFTNATTITIESAYQDGASYSGSYRIVNVINNVAIKDVTIKNSGSTALVGIDILDVELEDVVFLDNNKGFDFDNFSRITAYDCTIISNDSNGFELTQGTFFNGQLLASIANGGHGAVLNNIKSCTFVYSSGSSNTTDGYNCTDVTNCLFKLECSSNGGQGIEFVSGCNNNFINDSLIVSNTSDGIKLTATSDNNTIGNTCNITSNGGWGVNIAASSCDNNTITAPYFASNTSGDVTDSGTGTVNVTRQVISGSLLDITTNVTVANTTTETNLISVSIPANTLGTDKGIKARLNFSNLNEVSSGTGTIRIKYGSTTLHTITLSGTFSSAKGYLDVALLADGATNAQRSSYRIYARINPDNWANGATEYFGLNTATATEDSTGALNFVITIQWSVANAGNTITMSDGTTEKTN